MADLYNCCPLKSVMYYSNVAERSFDGPEKPYSFNPPKATPSTMCLDRKA